MRFGIEVLRRSGEDAMAYYGKGKSRMKFDEELITEAELILRDLFQDRLNAKFPKHQVFRNSQGTQDYSHEEKRYLWVYDPLDGVANFQAGIPLWGTSLALLENFWPIFGIFYLPVTGDLFHARVGDKSFVGTREICVSPQEDVNDESLLLTFSRFHNHYRSTFPGKIRDLGCTAAHICYVAMGRAEAALIANESYQNLAAARIIIEASGGKMFKMDGGEFFLNEYLDGQKIGEHLLIAAPHIYPQVRHYLHSSN